jgi:SAM-dependent methyltransferase
MCTEGAITCPLCGASARILANDLPGYMEGSCFSIAECPTCFSSHAFPFTADDAYDLIYSRAQQIPGYGRYERYAQGVLHTNSPLQYLAEEEETYWSMARVLTENFGVLGRGRKVLDFGSGLGYVTHALRQQGYEAAGLDVSEIAVDKAASRYGDHFHLVPAGPDTDPLLLGAFDCVIMNQVIEHLHDPVATVKHALSYLKPDGFLVVSTPTKPPDSDSIWDTDLPPVHWWWFGQRSLRHIAGQLNCSCEFYDYTTYYKLHYVRQTRPRTRGHVLSAQGDILEPQSHSAIRTMLRTAAGRVGALNTARHVRNLFSGRGRTCGPQGSVCTAVLRATRVPCEQDTSDV